MESGAFPHVTGQVIAAAVTDEYNAVPTIADMLVDTIPSSSRMEKFVGFQASDGPSDVAEGEEYPDAGMEDRATMGPEPIKRGFKITVTEETVVFDKTGLLLGRARSQSRQMVRDREKYVISSVQDLTGYKSFYPVVNGTPTQTDLYRTSAAGTAWYNKTINASTTALTLVDYTDVDAVLQLFAAMTDEQGELIDPITGAQLILLVPRALWATALKITKATDVRYVPVRTSAGDEFGTPGNVLDMVHMGGITAMTSVFMNGSTRWYVGDYKAQFKEQEIFPLQTVELPPDLTRDVVAGFRVRRKAAVYAVDDKFVCYGEP
jgi:hypothetical protein